MRARIYPLFMPHAGCPFRCVYCNQHAVTRVSEAHSTGSMVLDVKERMAQLARSALQSGIPGELAFYGGTFTQLPEPLLEPILDAAAEYVREGLFTGIRFSTRPDAMSPHMCSFLEGYPIQTVELGVQSLCDDVLRRTRRGYTARAVARSAGRVREKGWDLGIQLMPGLPGDSKERFLDSIAAAVELKPRFVRLYPTLVLEGTGLARWVFDGTYRPLSLKDAIDWCVSGWEALHGAGVPLARAGLHADPELERDGRIVAGPWHPAFGYLLRVHWWRRRVDERVAALMAQSTGDGGFQQASPPASCRIEGGMAQVDGKGLGLLSGGERTSSPTPCGERPSLFPAGAGRAGWRIEILVPKRQVSEVIGPKRINIRHWQRRWGAAEVRVTGDPGLSRDELCCRYASRVFCQGK